MEKLIKKFNKYHYTECKTLEECVQHSIDSIKPTYKYYNRLDRIADAIYDKNLTKEEKDIIMDKMEKEYEEKDNFKKSIDKALEDLDIGKSKKNLNEF